MLADLKELLRIKGYKIFTRPLELNIVGVRNNLNDPNKFNDELHVFFRSYSMEGYAWTDNEMQWNHYRFAICTDPACYTYYQQKNRFWDGLLEQGQYINGFKRAHQVDGKDGEVLLQKPRFPIRVFYECTEGVMSSVDLRNPNYYSPVPSGRIINTYYNICFEPPVDHDGKKWINEFGSGCQVFEHREEFELFMRLCTWHQHVYGNNFTYTLIDFKDPVLSANARLPILLTPSRPKQSDPDRQATH